jgi:DNA-binding transcriptional LysR family regulator
VELRQLEHFLAVVEEGSFTAAARRQYMVQSSLSASLLALERELGTDLFTRGRRGAELTDAGRGLLGPAQAALQQVQRAHDTVAEVTGLLRGNVRIATMTAGVPHAFDICEAVRRFRVEHPGVEVHLLPADARSAIDLVADGQVDLAVTPRTDRMNPGLHFEPLMRTRLSLICPAGHRLAGRREVDPRDLVGESIIDLPRTWQARALFDAVLHARGVQRRVGLEVDDWLGALAMVQRGMGITYGPLECVDEDLFGGLEVATLAGAPVWELGIATRDETLRGAAGRAFLAAYRRWCPANIEERTGAHPPALPPPVLPVDEVAGEQLRPVRVGAEREGGDHAEVATAAVQRPEEVGMLGLARRDLPAVGGHQLDRDQIVGSQPMGPGQPADASAEGEPRDAGAGHHPHRHDEPVRLGRRVDVGQRGPSFDAHGRRRRVDRHGMEITESSTRPSSTVPLPATS